MKLVDRWTEVETIMREKAYRRLDNDPQVLLEQDAWFNVDADLIFGRLYGLDGEIVQDGWQLRRIEPRVLLPIIPRSLLAMDDTPAVPTLRTATYVLQSGYVLVPMDAVYAPPGVEIRPDGTFVVLYLRYRRRL